MVDRIIVFAAHPDDETLGCGGTILKRGSEGYEIVIVVMTDGRHSLSENFGIVSQPSPDDLVQIRKREFFEVAKVLNVPKKNLRFFDFEDGTLAEHEVEASEKAIGILDEVKPVEVYFPYEKDINKDHQAASRIITESIRNTGLSIVQYQYSIAQRFSRISPIIAILLNHLLHHLILIDVSQFLGKKEAALRVYRSQTTVIANGQKKPVIKNVNKFLKNKELFYSAR